MTPDELSSDIASGAVDTVVMAFTDHYGRLMGKRFDASFFMDSGRPDGTHACNYLLTADMEMEPVEGHELANWSKGYGDFHLVADMSTLRRAAWTTRTAIVLCDVLEESSHAAVSVAPRSMLRRHVDAASALGLGIMAASELEFFMYRDSYRDAHAKGYRDLESSGWYPEDYHLFQGARVEDYVGDARRVLAASEIPVENSKGEAAVGQHELNIRYTDVLDMADRHVLMKQAMKELAETKGVSVSFMAKPVADQPGNSCHMHLSLWRGEHNVFAGASPGERSDLFRWFLGGWMHHTAELMVCYAPTVNSYKRYQEQSWAPTRLAWSTDNRTAGFRVVGNGPGLRIECRIPGGDVNPYLAYSAAIASGLDGIANQIEPPDEFAGDVYSSGIDRVPGSLRKATELFAASDDARRLLGEDVVDHYSHHFAMECDAYDRAVTDWEHRRYFEQI